ncbi:TetR/AcrR family transcriptional regulator [Streptomyces cavernicola]|uniref:TetR/AcrR family transcriptional regulator n=1 Tax=Streptomyces cavernicola TaxID=3043613 RepID=A0ABT6S326_9ACTN|nr:TetR/AcrR family transcriptional regulator [Streptomyces sp. B-S-A6]MDI3402294.1 TetR/AcrR family transcriptional regulator [Streptomyces sp. B-S-A6]
MGRLSRAQLQQLNRAKVLAAAREEFAARGFPGAKVDSIAERAGLTRGAVYSNFPGKQALYFAVLAELAESEPERYGTDSGAGTGRGGEGECSPRTAIAAFARAWTARLPLAGDRAAAAAGAGEAVDARLDTHLMSEVLADERTRQPYGQLLKLDALLLALALEQLRPAEQAYPQERPQDCLQDGRSDRARMVRVAESVLTSLHGARQLADAAPGFIEPFTVINACERLADAAPHDTWAPPHLPYVPHARPVDEPWGAASPESSVGHSLGGADATSTPLPMDAVRAAPARLGGDGVLVVLGLHRLEAVEEAVRAVPPGTTVTAVIVSGSPDELIPLARLAVADVTSCLRASFPPWAWPRLQVVYDASGSLAAAAGLPAVSDGTEAAVRIAGGRIVARADGRGACHAAATADLAPLVSTAG